MGPRAQTRSCGFCRKHFYSLSRSPAPELSFYTTPLCVRPLPVPQFDVSMVTAYYLEEEETATRRWGLGEDGITSTALCQRWTRRSTPVTPAARCAAGASIASSRTRCPYETWALVLTRLPSDTKCWGWASGCAQHSGHCCEFRARWAASELQAVRDKRWEPVLKYFRAREMIWWLRALAALSGDPGSILSLMSMSND